MRKRYMSNHAKTTTPSFIPNRGVVKLFKDINGRGGSAPGGFSLFRDRLYFVAADPIHGSELWVSNGTTRGTYLLKDIYPSRNSSAPRNLIEFDNQLYFSADDGVHGRELWRSDGTALGTNLFKDFEVPPPGSGYSDSDPRAFVQVGNKLYFATLEGPLIYTTNLWVTDGTTAGTQKVMGGNNVQFPTPFTEFGGKLYFSDMINMGAIDPTNNAVLWSQLVGVPREPTEFDGKLYFGNETL
jgi:ELWxxDGT repeat protein